MDDNDDDFYDGPDESENESYDSNGIAIYMHIFTCYDDEVSFLNVYRWCDIYMS